MYLKLVESIRKTKLNLLNFVTLSKQQMQTQAIIKVPVSYLYTKTFFFHPSMCMHVLYRYIPKTAI